MAKPKRRKASLHAAGKLTEQDLLERARELYEEPARAIPICEGPCVLFSPVKAARRQIMRVHRARDNETALLKFASKGNDLARAFAATLLLAKSEKVPVVADLRLGGDIVPYVMRGSAKPFFLAGVQHHDDRAHRLLSVAQWARKRGLHFYSADRGILCTGRRVAPPADFIAEEAELLELQKKSETLHTCGHDGDGVSLRWLGTDVTFERCLSCAEGGSLLSSVRRHVAVPDVERQFDATPRLEPLKGPAPKVSATPSAEVQKAYLAGKLTDAQYVEAGRLARVAALRAQGAHFVAGNVSYGDDADAFLRALEPTPDDERALRAAFAAHKGPVVIERATLARAIAELWPDHGRRMLEAVSNTETADALHRPKAAPDEALELIRRAAREGAARTALASLPRYSALPPGAAAADAVARAYRTQGRDAAVRMAQERANVARAKGVALAMLTALSAQRGQEWRFSQSDRDVADALATHVSALLTGPADKYHEELAAVSRSAGETESFDPR